MKNILTICGVMITCNLAFANEAAKLSITLEDQYERKVELSKLQGDVFVLLYGDKGGVEPCKKLGEALHVYYHPTAKGKTGAEAAKQPVTPVAGIAEGARSPDVRIIPVACVSSKTPDLVKGIIRNQIRKEVPETPVLLDFESKLKEAHGQKDGEPNVLLIDHQGRVRMKINGELNADAQKKLLEAIDFLRKEAAEKK